MHTEYIIMIIILFIKILKKLFFYAYDSIHRPWFPLLFVLVSCYSMLIPSIVQLNRLNILLLKQRDHINNLSTIVNKLKESASTTLPIKVAEGTFDPVTFVGIAVISLFFCLGVYVVSGYLHGPSLRVMDKQLSYYTEELDRVINRLDSIDINSIDTIVINHAMHTTTDIAVNSTTGVVTDIIINHAVIETLDDILNNLPPEI